MPKTPGKYAIVPPATPHAASSCGESRRSDLDERMPPESTHKKLTALEVAVLRQWIETAQSTTALGLHPPKRPAVPQTAFARRATNDIDRFCLQEARAESLEPAAEADKETLINRVTLTLTGLPPKIEDVDAFLKDTAPDAYERLVDRLLASAAYAEHMAEYWLDLARCSESDGFLDDHHDRYALAVARLGHRRLPEQHALRQFGTTQLAGDLLPSATKDQVLATAFLRVGKRTTENGAIDAEYKAEYMVERTDNALGVAFLGLTVGCARCHDHKYDPIKQRDYYSLGAFFNSNDEPGAYAPGFSGIQGGPTLPWPDAGGSSETRRGRARGRGARGGLRGRARAGGRSR